MRVLQISSEATPFAKTGGLADVAGALPDSLGREGCDCTLVAPAYREVFEKNHSTLDAATYFTDCIRKGIDEGCVTAAVFVDFRKAFDSVNHQLLIKTEIAWFGIQTMN